MESQQSHLSSSPAREEDKLYNRSILESLLGMTCFRQLEEDAQLSGRRLTQAIKDVCVSHQGSRTDKLLCHFPFWLSRAVFPLCQSGETKREIPKPPGRPSRPGPRPSKKNENANTPDASPNQFFGTSQRGSRGRPRRRAGGFTMCLTHAAGYRCATTTPGARS
ncbi:hypothetical protein DPEC_G00087790 [Dallia pectoralis]|uniref:Uncharacterized protein n=1 Tax=Dallia pectoralis TaxID=75939 RepID=A0ACC2H083_DALPE|nr:hypothetical protein DPEC_G00087790 [Dallia pectoralis]